MPNNVDAYVCRVCGYNCHPFMPWGEDMEVPSFDICDCCGVEWGYEDLTLDGIHRYRQQWAAKGFPWAAKRFSWFNENLIPPDWDAEKQMQAIPERFR